MSTSQAPKLRSPAIGSPSFRPPHTASIESGEATDKKLRVREINSRRVVRCQRECAGSTTQHGLFSKKITFCFLAEIRFNHARAGAPNPFRPGQRCPLGAPASILMNGN